MGGSIHLGAVARRLGLGRDILDLTITEILVLNPSWGNLSVGHVLLDLVVAKSDCDTMLRDRVSRESVSCTFDKLGQLLRPWSKYPESIRCQIQTRHPDRPWSTQPLVRLEDFCRALVMTESDVYALTWLTSPMLGVCPPQQRLFALDDLRLQFHPSYFLRFPLDPVHDSRLASWNLTRAELRRCGIGPESPGLSPR